MTVDNPTAGTEPTEVNIPVAPAPSKDGPISARDGMRSVMDWRRKSAAEARGETQSTDASADDATSETKSTEAKATEDAALAETQPSGETESGAEPAETQPPIDPPKSWTKEAKERFNSLPRETQEYLATRETERDREIRRGQNEAAEARKGLDAERVKVEQARSQYESALPQLLDTLQQQQAGEFSDVKTISDVERLAREDWPRYLQWDLAQKKVAAVHQEMMAAQQRQANEKFAKFSEFAKKEDSLFAEKVPDMATPEKAAKLQQQALTVLKDLGFTDDELGASWNGQKDLSLRDHRLQLIIRDAILYREAQAAAAKVRSSKTPVPPVQRPGVSGDKNAARNADLEALGKKIENSSGLNALRAAAKFVAERRRA